MVASMAFADVSFYTGIQLSVVVTSRFISNHMHTDMRTTQTCKTVKTTLNKKQTKATVRKRLEVTTKD